MNRMVRFLDEAFDVGFQDKLHMPTKRKFKISGQMIAPCSIARTGIMEYKAKECGSAFKDHDPESIVKIMTLAEDLFDEASIESYRSAPITVGHPTVDVDTENAKDLLKGVLEGMPMKDESGEMLIGTLVINDADTIALVRANTNQLSSGHTASLVMCDYDSVGYHAKKTNIRANHIAIVPKGRAGVAAIEDSAAELEEVVEEQETVDVVPEVVLEAVVEDVKVVDAALVLEVETLKAKLDSTEAKLTDALATVAKLQDIDALVEQRMAFVAEVLSICDGIDVKGKSQIEIKREVVTKACPTAPANMSDQYVEVRYGILLEDKDFVHEKDTEMSTMLRDVAGIKVKHEDSQSPAVIARENMIKRYQGDK